MIGYFQHAVAKTTTWHNGEAAFIQKVTETATATVAAVVHTSPFLLHGIQIAAFYGIADVRLWP